MSVHTLSPVPDGTDQVQISCDATHPEWDTFVSHTPGGHHAQTSLWAKTKPDWDSARVVICQNGRIAAGAQMLIRSMPLLGALGYVPKGPVCADPDPAIEECLIQELHRLARTRQVRCLAVQPPNNAHVFARRLPRRGFRLATVKMAQPAASVLVDLTEDLDTILAGMHAKTRYNIRLGQRKGSVVRRAPASDLPVFHRLLEITGKRQGFKPETEAQLKHLYRTLAPSDMIALFLVEYNGEPVSGALVVTFGDTVIYKRGAWSGRHGKYRPNEVMHWEIMRWAKSQGYCYYDFEGIDPRIAQALLQGKSPDLTAQPVTRFKLGFGGQVLCFPGVYTCFYNPVFRWIYSLVQNEISDHLCTKRLLRSLLFR